METHDDRQDKLALGSQKRLTEIEAKIATLEKARAENNFVVLGDTLRIPVGPWFTLALFLVLLAVSLFAWLAPADRVSAILVAVFKEKQEDGRIVEDKDKDKEISSIYTLVTPHAETLNDLKAQGVSLSDEEKAYYTLEPGALEAFGKQIKEEGAQGYSRREVWGEGTKPLKRGWEWTINWRKSRAIKIARLVEIFDKYFHRSKGIYIEERNVGNTLFDREQASRK